MHTTTTSTSTSASPLLENGYSSLTGVLTPEEAAILRRESVAFLSQDPRPYSELRDVLRDSNGYQLGTFTNDSWTIVMDPLGTSAEFDRLLEKVASHPAVMETLRGVMGPDFKLWQVTLREAKPGGIGQNLHQDSTGGVNFSILLDETNGEGTTVFLRGSHTWPISIVDFGSWLQKPSRLKRLLTTAAGKPGDVFFWLNRTWHGRNPGPRPSIAVMFAFHAAGSTYPLKRLPPEVLARLGPTLRTLLDPDQGVELVDQGRRARVAGDERSFPSTQAREVLTESVPRPALSGWTAVATWATCRRALKRQLVRTGLVRAAS